MLKTYICVQNAEKTEELNMKKVLKLNARSVVEVKDGGECQCVKLNFQVYKDGKPNFGSHVIIYRREETGYVFDYDEWEYFDCLLPREDEIVFDGELEIDNTFCEYTDYDVEVGKTYVYWVGRERFGEYLTGPAPVTVRDRRVWWHFDEILEKTYALQKDFPNDVTLEQVGNTVYGKPLVAAYVGNRKNLIACVGAVHAGESGPEILLPLVRELLTEHHELLERCGMAILPVVNADMREKMVDGAPWYIRTNAVGVDLNRNFDADWELIDYSYNLSSADYRSPTYRGPYPNSEPEVRALIKLMESAAPRALFSFHFLCSITADGLIVSKSAKDDVPYLADADEVKQIYSDSFRDAIGAQRRENYKAGIVCSAGSLPTYMYRKHGIPAFDLEISGDLDMLMDCKRDQTTPEMVDIARRGHKDGLIKMLERYSV